MFSKRFSRKIRKKQHPDEMKGFKISTATKQYSPWELHDTQYLEHLREHAKLRETYEGSLLRRNELLQSNKRKNYQMELDRLINELHRPNLPYATREHLEKRIEELKKLTFV